MALFHPRIAVAPELMERIRAHVRQVGYASVEEFVTHCVEKELRAVEVRSAADERALTERLRGLGYLE
ncbi:MAG: hypothetical protein ABIL09_22935 [Gemmatimonadota bacterium]